MHDFGEGRWIVGRKDHRCEACLARIPRGEEHFHYKGMYGGDWQDWHMHRECHDYLNDCGEFTPGDCKEPQRLKSEVR